MIKKRPFIISKIRRVLLKLFRLTYKFNVIYIRSREEFPFILNAKNLKGEGVEVGVWKGDYSESILKKWNGTKLYSVDPWKTFNDNSYKDGMNITQFEFDKIFDYVNNLLTPFGKKSQIIRNTSKEAVKLFNINQLDFVYIDAQHHYQAIKEDIEIWYSKVKKGGILAGHDYLDGNINNTEFGVKKAVNEFVKLNKLKLVICDRDDFKSWFIFK